MVAVYASVATTRQAKGALLWDHERFLPRRKLRQSCRFCFLGI